MAPGAVVDRPVAGRHRSDAHPRWPWGATREHPRPGSDPTKVLGPALILVVLTQRLALPIGPLGLSVTLVVGYAALAWLLLRGLLTHDVPRVALFALGGAACGLTTWLTVWTSGLSSFSSYALLIVCYFPWIFRVADSAAAPAHAAKLCRLFVRLMVILGLVSILQMTTQLTGLWEFQDLLGERVPEQWLVANYNTVGQVEYGSPYVKSQAFVFLEASFLSQFLGLATVIGVIQRAPVWQLTVLGLGVLCTVSGTGIVLLLFGLLLVLLRAPSRLRPSLLVAGTATLVALLTSPLAGPLIERTEETEVSTSSYSLRFEAPYRETIQGLEDEPVRYLIGAGAGTADLVLENSREGTGFAVVYTIVPKLVFEYGLPAGVMFAAFLLVALLRRPSIPVLPATLAVMLGLLSGSLLQPHTLMLAWMLGVVWGRE